MDFDLSDISDDEDPRIAEAANEMAKQLRVLQDELGLDVAAAFYDAIAERLDALIEETEKRLEAEDEDDDEDLLEVEDDPDET